MAMSQFLNFIAICAIFVTFVSTLSLPPVVDEGLNVDALDQGQQALIAMSEDGNPEVVIVGEDVGRADFSKIRNLFNFTAYLQGRPENVSSLSFVPLITILSSIGG